VQEAWRVIRSCQHLTRLGLHVHYHDYFSSGDIDDMVLTFWEESEDSSDAAPLKLEHLEMKDMPLPTRHHIDLAAITALTLDSCHGLPVFLSHWRRHKLPINLRTLRLGHECQVLSSQTAPLEALSAFMTSFSGLVEFVLDADYKADTWRKNFVSDKLGEDMLANHFETLETVRNLSSLST
jgi:hypothetical protein